MTMTLSREKPEAVAAAPIPVVDESGHDRRSSRACGPLARVTAEGVTLPADAAEMAGDTLVDLRRYLRPDPVRA